MPVRQLRTVSCWEIPGRLLVVLRSSGRFLGGRTKRGRLLVAKWAFVGRRRGISLEAITYVMGRSCVGSAGDAGRMPRRRQRSMFSHNVYYVIVWLAARFGLSQSRRRRCHDQLQAVLDQALCLRPLVHTCPRVTAVPDHPAHAAPRASARVAAGHRVRRRALVAGRCPGLPERPRMAGAGVRTPCHQRKNRAESVFSRKARASRRCPACVGASGGRRTLARGRCRARAVTA